MTMYKAKRPYYATNQSTKNMDDITNKAEKITDSSPAIAGSWMR